MKDPLKVKYTNKKWNAYKENIEFNLTLDQYISLMKKANITIKDIAPNGYHLSRYNDNGAYEIGNCRFITYLENAKEKTISEKSIKASKINIEIARKKLLKITPEQRKKWKKPNRDNIASRLTKEEISKRLNKIEKSNIDLTKFGWVGKVAELLNVTHTQSRRFMSKHYNGYLYKRKSPVGVMVTSKTFDLELGVQSSYRA